MIRAAVCEDEQAMAELLAGEIRGFFARKQLDCSVRRFSSGAALLESGEAPDVLFLDIRMEGPDGMETARRLRAGGYRGYLIFTTVLPEYVYSAFEVRAFDYLLKPLQADAFARTMERLLSSLQTEARLLIRQGSCQRLIPFEQILYGEVIDRELFLHLTGGEVVTYYGKIRLLEEELDHRFFRCHRSYLVNLQHLQSLEDGIARLDGGGFVPVSRLRRDAFGAALRDYLGR